jgi:hypothetical protein
MLNCKVSLNGEFFFYQIQAVNIVQPTKFHIHFFIFFKRTVPEIIDPVFAKTSLKRSFCMTENERFWLVFFAKTGSINSGTGGAS